jgi:hypothetical protein
MAHRDPTLHDLQQWHQRRKGIIKRRLRNPGDRLTHDQQELAERMQDRYQLSWDDAVIYLDWWAQLAKGWIDVETFVEETGKHPYH